MGRNSFSQALSSTDTTVNHTPWICSKRGLINCRALVATCGNVGFVLLFLGCAVLDWHSSIPDTPALAMLCFSRSALHGRHSPPATALVHTCLRCSLGRTLSGSPRCLQRPAAATRALGKLPGSGGFRSHLFLCPATGNPNSLHTSS